MNFNYKRLDRMSKLIFIVAIATGFLIFTPPLGKEFKGARRWVGIGTKTFMPSDVIKLGSIIFLSSFYPKKRIELETFGMV